MRTYIALAAPGLLAPLRANLEQITPQVLARVLLLCALAPIRAIFSRLRGAKFSRALLWVLGTGLGTGLAGCLPSPANVPPQQYFVLSDLAKPAPGQRPVQGAGRALLINPTVTSPFYDTQSLVYSRTAGQRGYYQFAGWTERPGRRFSELLMRRLEARGAFASVASTTAGVKGDVLVNTRLEELYQDTSVSPGRVVVEVTAEIVDYTERTVVARRRFAQSAATTGDNATAAVAAFNQATTILLDEVSAWIEGAAATRPQPRQGALQQAGAVSPS